jgi:hypothetical protein
VVTRLNVHVSRVLRLENTPRHKIVPWLLAGLLSAVVAPAFAEPCGPARLEIVTVSRVSPDGDIVLSDGRALRLAGVQATAAVLFKTFLPRERLAVGALTETPDRWARFPALVFKLPDAGPPVLMQQDMLASGLALARPERDLGSCWEIMTKAEARATDLPQTIMEPGRFARVEGRVSRVGEGRSARFISVYDKDRQRTTGVVQKKNMKRLAEAGVDVAKLSGQTVRIRGVRGLRNPATIALTMVEQIEIVP